MNKNLKEAFRQEMKIAREFYANQELKRAFIHLERAHILGQSYVIPHTISHWWMFKIGLRRRDGKEIFGQIFRIIASLLVSRVWVPLGNTGGVNVSPFKPMKVPADINTILESAHESR